MCILYLDNREFSVLGDVAIAAPGSIQPPNRVNFKFKTASLKIPPFINVNLPPVGEGWFDNIYVNDRYRLSKDIRGDYLISKRVAV